MSALTVHHLPPPPASAHQQPFLYGAPFATLTPNLVMALGSGSRSAAYHAPAAYGRPQTPRVQVVAAVRASPTPGQSHRIVVVAIQFKTDACSQVFLRSFDFSFHLSAFPLCRFIFSHLRFSTNRLFVSR
jgi:hypothetical protein